MGLYRPQPGALRTGRRLADLSLPRVTGTRLPGHRSPFSDLFHDILARSQRLRRATGVDAPRPHPAVLRPRLREGVLRPACLGMRFFVGRSISGSPGALTKYACCLFDPAVTPPGQFSVANAHRGAKRYSIFLTGHFDFNHPGLAAEWQTHEKNLRAMDKKAIITKGSAP